MLKDLYLIPLIIYIFSYFVFAFKDKKYYKLFIYLIYAGFICQSIIFLTFLGIKGFAVPVHIDRFVFFNAWILMLVVVIFGFFYKVEYILLYITPLVAAS